MELHRLSFSVGLSVSLCVKKDLNLSKIWKLEKSENKYSISEVSQIVESNNGKLLGIYVSGQKIDSTQITLKVNCKDINEIMNTFRRYEYKIISIHDNDKYLEDLKNRSEYLQKYLEM